MDRVFVVGAGGFGRELMLYVQDLQGRGARFEIAGFLDDNPDALSGVGAAAPIVGSIDGHSPSSTERFAIGVGDPAVRRRIASTLSQRGAKYLTVVHPQAWVAPDAQLGEGCVLAPFTFVGPGASLGDQVLLNCFASVGHDADVEKFSVLSPYAVINGAAKLGQQVFLGTHATVVAGKKVGAYSKVSAGSVALRDVPAGALVSGNPGKSRVMFDIPQDG
jgi:sugar O-acyltransferase (sialic acid O-acetyltransferase NeuD family)